MSDLSAMLEQRELMSFRSSYDHDAMVLANVRGVAGLVPELGSWNEEIGRTFYRRSGPLAPAERERCLISLIAATGPALPLAVHVYWGLMEGLSVDELLQIVGLVACYAGLPRLGFGLEVVERVLRVLKELSQSGGREPSVVLAALMKEFSLRSVR